MCDNYFKQSTAWESTCLLDNSVFILNSRHQLSMPAIQMVVFLDSMLLQNLQM